MRIVSAGDTVKLTADSDDERASLGAIGARFNAEVHNGTLHIVSVDQDGMTLAVRRLTTEATFAPIDITFDTTPMPLQLISNLAHTPFELDGRRYASIEGFWQGLKFPASADRARIAALSGHAAKRAGPSSQPGDRIVYEAHEICVGTVDHWALMERACAAKFTQHEGARAALASSRGHPLQHTVHPDSRTIPGIVMADIWTRIRSALA